MCFVFWCFSCFFSQDLECCSIHKRWCWGGNWSRRWNYSTPSSFKEEGWWICNWWTSKTSIRIIISCKGLGQVCQCPLLGNLNFWWIKISFLPLMGWIKKTQKVSSLDEYCFDHSQNKFIKSEFIWTNIFHAGLMQTLMVGKSQLNLRLLIKSRSWNRLTILLAVISSRP